MVTTDEGRSMVVLPRRPGEALRADQGAAGAVVIGGVPIAALGSSPRGLARASQLEIVNLLAEAPDGEAVEAVKGGRLCGPASDVVLEVRVPSAERLNRVRPEFRAKISSYTPAKVLVHFTNGFDHVGTAHYAEQHET